MKTKNKFKWDATVISLYLFIGLITMGAVSVNVQEGDKWDAPAPAAKVENPTDAADKENMAVGKGLYTKHCKSCHGKEGLGDGPKAEELDTPSGDFTEDEFQAQSDGSLFYKIKEGRDDMPSFKKKITDDEDLWLIVNYVRTLK